MRSWKIVAWRVLLFGLLFPVHVMAFNPGVTLMGDTGSGQWKHRVTFNEMRAHSRTLRTLDLNFKSHGLQTFTGIYLNELIQLSRRSPRKGVTIIGSDQYVTYLPLEELARTFLAWHQGGGPISPLEGGELKVLFHTEDGVHRACYTWYVKTLVMDQPRAAALTLTTARGRQVYGRDALVNMAEPVAPHFVAIPRGCRHALKTPGLGQSLLAVPFSRLLPADTPAQTLTGHSLAGPPFELDARILPWMKLVVGYGEAPLHPAMGGPFALIFPLDVPEAYQSMVPVSGGIFFITEISVR